MSSRKPSSSDIPGPSRLLQGILGSKANAGHNRMKVWRELNMPASCFDLLKPNTFSLPDKLLRHSAKLKPLRGPHERKTKKGVKSKFLSIKQKSYKIVKFCLQKSNRTPSCEESAKNFVKSLLVLLSVRKKKLQETMDRFPMHKRRKLCDITTTLSMASTQYT
jgi:hypothetical protein